MKDTSDKEKDRIRYDQKANKTRESLRSNLLKESTYLDGISIPLRKPYFEYRKLLSTYIYRDYDVLEIGSGTGNHSLDILEIGCKLVASDISDESLKVLKDRYKVYSDNLTTKVADMENLPFESKTFDVVCSAGVLSYGDANKVKLEIKRVLKKDGLFICVDSFNHNPVFKVNRLIHFLLNNRTWSSVKRIPNLRTIDMYKRDFVIKELAFFGCISWLTPLISLLIGSNRAATLSDNVDGFFNIKRSAFKFVMVASLKD